VLGAHREPADTDISNPEPQSDRPFFGSRKTTIGVKNAKKLFTILNMDHHAGRHYRAGAGSRDIVLQLRFYEGVRGPAGRSEVVTAYTMRPLFIGNFITEKGSRKRKPN